MTDRTSPAVLGCQHPLALAVAAALLISPAVPAEDAVSPGTLPTRALCAALAEPEPDIGRVQSMLSMGADPDGPCVVTQLVTVPIEYGPSATESIGRSLRRNRRPGGLIVALILLPVMPIIALADGLSRATRPDERTEEQLVQLRPLHLALEAESELAFASLLVAGADPLAEDERGLSALGLALVHAARSDWRAPLERVLDRGVPIDSLEPYDPELLVALTDRDGLLELLCDHGLDPDAAPDGESPALHWALSSGDGTAAEALLGCGADPESISRKGHRAVDTALRSNHPELLELLIAHGASLETEDRSGRSALIRAIDRGAVEDVALLLERGVLLDHADDAGASPLHHAAGHRYGQSTTLLLAAGADIGALDARGHTPLRWALWEGHTEPRTLLLERGAPLGPDIQSWVLYEGGKLVDPPSPRDAEPWQTVTMELIDHGLPIDQPLRELVVAVDDADFALRVFAEDEEGTARDYRRLRRKRYWQRGTPEMRDLLWGEVRRRRQ